jgi:putative aldouronate transport system substrate-binding protein
VDSLNNGVLPTTTEELYDFLEKVKTAYPSSIPMTGFLGGWASDPFTFISNAFVQNNNIMSNTNPVVAAGFVVDGAGNLQYNLISDEYREALVYMNRLYAEGLLDPQAYTQTSDQANATLDNEPHLVALMGGGAMPQNSNFWSQEEGDWQNWTILPPLRGPNGVQLAYTGVENHFGSSIGLVSTDSLYPEIAVKLFDLIASEEGTMVTWNGVEGITWEWTNEGTNLVGGTPIWRKLTPEHRTEDGGIDWAAYGFDFKDAQWDSDAVMSGATSEFREGEAVDDPSMNVEAVLFRCATIYHQFAAHYSTLVPGLSFTEEQARRLSEYTVSVGSYANSASIRFITGDMNIATDWEQYLAEMERMDVRGYIALMQEAFDANMAG